MLRLRRSFLFVQLVPKVDVLIYGAVQQALSFGVRLWLPVTLKKKAFTAARVDWTGAGINLETRPPTPEQRPDGKKNLVLARDTAFVEKNKVGFNPCRS
jgi:hypothetical protein